VIAVEKARDRIGAFFICLPSVQNMRSVLPRGQRVGLPIADCRLGISDFRYQPTAIRNRKSTIETPTRYH
jgi:hypothetical protein